MFKQESCSRTSSPSYAERDVFHDLQPFKVKIFLSQFGMMLFQLRRRRFLTSMLEITSWAYINFQDDRSIGWDELARLKARHYDMNHHKDRGWQRESDGIVVKKIKGEYPYIPTSCFNSGWRTFVQRQNRGRSIDNILYGPGIEGVFCNG